MTLAFFIDARAETLPSSPDRPARSTRFLLWGAPSEETARTWGEDHARRLILNGEHQVSTIKVIPVHERLLTMEEDEIIDWPSLAESAEALARGRYYSIEDCTSMRFKFQPPSMATREKPWESGADEFAQLEEQFPDALGFNWNPQEESYYLAYHEERAFIVRAMNLLFVSRSYTRAFEDIIKEEHDLFMQAWPGAQQWVA